MFRLLVLLCFATIILGEDEVLTTNPVTCYIQYYSCIFASTIPKNQEIVIIVDNSKYFLKEKDITKVRFEENLLHSIPKELFTKFFNLKDLDMHNQNIIMIEPNNFEKAHNLTHLDLSKNKIKKLDKFDFVGAENLQEIKLFTNEISDIHNETFRKLKNLEVLYLFSNQIKDLDRNTFYSLKNLKVLNLGSNSLEFLHRKLFIKNINLELLNLHQNKFSAISHGMFSHLKKLKKLEFVPNYCINQDYTPDAKSQYRKIEKDLRDCSLSYLFLENEELNANFDKKVSTLNKAISSIRKKFTSIEGLIGGLTERLDCSKYEKLKKLKYQ